MISERRPAEIILAEDPALKDCAYVIKLQTRVNVTQVDKKMEAIGEPQESSHESQVFLHPPSMDACNLSLLDHNHWDDYNIYDYDDDFKDFNEDFTEGFKDVTQVGWCRNKQNKLHRKSTKSVMSQHDAMNPMDPMSSMGPMGSESMGLVGYGPGLGLGLNLRHCGTGCLLSEGVETNPITPDMCDLVMGGGGRYDCGSYFLDQFQGTCCETQTEAVCCDAGTLANYCSMADVGLQFNPCTRNVNVGMCHSARSVPLMDRSVNYSCTGSRTGCRGTSTPYHLSGAHGGCSGTGFGGPSIHRPPHHRGMNPFLGPNGGLPLNGHLCHGRCRQNQHNHGLGGNLGGIACNHQVFNQHHRQQNNLFAPSSHMNRRRNPFRSHSVTQEMFYNVEAMNPTQIPLDLSDVRVMSDPNLVDVAFASSDVLYPTTRNWEGGWCSPRDMWNFTAIPNNPKSSEVSDFGGKNNNKQSDDEEFEIVDIRYENVPTESIFRFDGRNFRSISESDDENDDPFLQSDDDDREIKAKNMVRNCIRNAPKFVSL